MQLHGLPELFWVVTKPSPVSELGDICFQCTYGQLMRQTLGGLHEDDIIAIYADETEAKEQAKALLDDTIVRTSDSLVVEVLVNVVCQPTTKDMTARELSRAVVSAVENAVRHAEKEGYKHQLEGKVAMGVGTVEIHSQTTVFG